MNTLVSERFFKTISFLIQTYIEYMRLHIPSIPQELMRSVHVDKNNSKTFPAAPNPIVRIQMLSWLPLSPAEHHIQNRDNSQDYCNLIGSTSPHLFHQLLSPRLSASYPICTENLIQATKAVCCEL